MSNRRKRIPGESEIHFEVRHFDSPIPLAEYRALPKRPLYIILDNLRSAFNVGAIFRTCDALRVSGLYLCGCTAYPPHVKLDKTAAGTIDYVPWKRFESGTEAVCSLKERGVAVWAAETTARSRSYLSVAYPAPLGIVFGNESLGISGDVLALCDMVVEIPLAGYKNSINVATAAGIIGFRASETMALPPLQILQ